MLLTAPTIEELQNLEMASLVDMLAQQTGFYTKHIKEIGFTHESETYRQLIVDIQKAIKLKGNLAKNSTATGTVNRFTQYTQDLRKSR
jgi:hypothetical protein